MAENGKFDLDSGTLLPGFTGSSVNGSKGNHSGPVLDRSGSFREGGESRSFSSGNSTFRSSRQLIGGSSTSLKGLMLEPMLTGDLKNSRSGELKKVFTLSGLASEEHSLGAAHSRPLPSATVDELKRIKESFSEVKTRARVRVKKLSENLHKLDKITEAPSCKNRQRSEPSSNERSSGSNLKIGAQICRNSLVDDRAKNGVPNKRVRTSMAESQIEGRRNGLSRQSSATTKDLYLLKDNFSQPDMAEEKISRLPVGEGWHKKIKRKRSVSKVLTRSLDIDGDLKGVMLKSFCNEGGSQGNGSVRYNFNGNSGSLKKDIISSPILNASAIPNHDQDKALTVDLSSGLHTDRLTVKGNIIREENHNGNTCSVTKTKASRPPRGGPASAVNSSTNILRSGEHEICKQSTNLSKIQKSNGNNNKKRSIPSVSTSSMTQWVGQRPHKISRARRANLLSPVSNPDNTQVSADGYSPPNIETRINSNGGVRGRGNGKHHHKMKVENASSPARFSECEESGAGESRMKEKGTGISGIKEKAGTSFPCFGTSTMFAKKDKLPTEDMDDCVRKQGRNERGSPFSISSTSPMTDKMENAATANSLRSSRPTSDKNGSKTRRPPKKLVDRKGFYRKAHVPNSGSPDITGELDDDYEELLTSARFASNPSNLTGSNTIWKDTECCFAPVSSQERSFLAQELQVEEKLKKNLPQMTGCESNFLDETDVPAAFFSEAVDTDGVRQKEAVNSIVSVERLKESETSKRLGSEGISYKRMPLYQRVLSALIVEDKIEELEENGTERNVLPQHAVQSLSCDDEHSRTVGKEGRYQLHCSTEMEKQSGASMHFPYGGLNGSVGQNFPCSVDKSQAKIGFSHEVGGLTGFCRNSLVGPPFAHSNGFGNSSSDKEYEQLCIEDKILLELHSIGIYPETVPDLDDRDNTMTVEETIQLNASYYKQQVVTTKESMERVYGAVLQDKEEEKRAREEVAMDRLVQLAYEKIPANKGSFASKSGTPKVVSKNVSLGFAERTLTRCRAFEDSGESFLKEKPFRDVLFAEPKTSHDETEPTCTSGPTYKSAEQQGPNGNLNEGSSDLFETCQKPNHGPPCKSAEQNGPSGKTCKKPDKGLMPVQTRGKKRDTLLDNISGAGSCSGAKRKRNEKETSNRFPKTKDDTLSKCSIGDGKTKTKYKQKKTKHLSLPGNASIENKSTKANPKRVGECNNNFEKSTSVSNEVEEEEPLDLANFPQLEFNTIDELGKGEIDLGGGQQDLTSWLNFEGLEDEDEDFSMGLQIPMDDISTLQMI